MSRRSARSADPGASPAQAVAAVLDTTDVVWFPVRHHSPACAWHVQRVVRELRPAAVLVEGPDDATAHLPALVHAGTTPPISILSTWVDRKNVYGLNGSLTPTDDIPVRYRAWWPFTAYSPEYVALVEGARVGAELLFVDAPLPATLPFDHARRGEASGVLSDRNLAEGSYFERLRARQRRRSFAEFWDANFEVDAFRLSTRAFQERVLTFAWCTRNVAGVEALEADGTLLREAHMRWHVDQARKRHTGPILVVTGAFHSVALPSTKGKRAKAKADRDTTTLLCAHSYPALARLSDQNRSPAYGHTVWQAAIRGEARPHDTAALELLTAVMRLARDEGQPVSTADAAGGWTVAQNLAELRGNSSPTLHDLLDAVEMAYVKGEAGAAGVVLHPVTRRVLVGDAVGTVSELAGEVPLISAYYAGCKEHRLDVTGEHKVVRCDVGKQAKHRTKSAFLHLCDFLEVPMFASVDREGGWRASKAHFRGPDPTTGADMHLLVESWGVRWTEEVDDRLIELADRGSALTEVAGNLLDERTDAARGDVSATTRLLLQTARMALLDRFDPALEAVEDALREDRRFLSLTGALADFVLLVELREGLSTRSEARLLDVLASTWQSGVLQLPALAALDPDDVREHVQRLQDLVRLALVFEARPLDLSLLVEQLERLRAVDGCEPGLRGAALGVLYSLGHRRESEVADELELLLRGAGAAEAGRFLEGLFTAGRSVLLGGNRLLAAVDRVLGALDWAAFRSILPDLRRAFTQFIPSELDALGARVAAHIGLSEVVDPDRPVPDGLIALIAAADRRASASLRAWLEDPLAQLEHADGG
jgi:hypothetical protein